MKKVWIVGVMISLPLSLQAMNYTEEAADELNKPLSLQAMNYTKTRNYTDEAADELNMILVRPMERPVYVYDVPEPTTKKSVEEKICPPILPPPPKKIPLSTKNSTASQPDLKTGSVITPKKLTPSKTRRRKY